MSACEICTRKGVLIHPVRYAVACPAGAGGVPGLSGNFKIENAPSDIGKAKYALRAVRAGYMYAYDEKRKRLRSYMVMPNLTLWNFPIEYLPPQPSTVLKNGCTNPDELTFGRCIDIVHTASDPATNIWIGWSSVVWTKELIAKIGDSAWRKKHMQCINVPAMLAGTAAHSAEFAKHYKEIAHFGADKDSMHKAFAFSNKPTDAEVGQRGLATSLLETMAAHGPYKKGFIVALNDPVGITNDMSELTLPTVDAGFDEDVARGKMVYDLLVATEKNIRDDARLSVVLSEQMADMYADNPSGDFYNSFKTTAKVIKAGGFGKYEAKLKADKKKYGDSEAGRQDAAADQAWEEVSTEEKGGKRQPLLDIGRFKNFPHEYMKVMTEFQPEYEKLAHSHAAWLASEQLANWMEGVHDTKDICSGYAFSESLAQCIGKGVSSEACSRQLLTWLNSGSLSDPRNLYARALLFNHEELIKATEPGLKGSDLQYENILNIYKVILLRLDGRRAAKLIDRLALATANVLVKALSSGAYSIMLALTKLHLTLVAQVRIKPSTSSAAELGAWIIEQAEARGVRLSESNKKSRNAAHKHAVAATTDVNKKKIVAYQIDMEMLRAEGRITESTIKKIKLPGFDLAERWLGSSTPREFHLGVVTVIVQLLALAFVAQDIVNEDNFNQLERNFKGATAIVGLSSTLFDMAVSTAAKAPTHPIAAFLPGQWAGNTGRVEIVIKVARGIGCTAGIVAGIYDLTFNLASAWKEDKLLLTILYGTNGVLGIAVAMAGYAEAAFFWPLLIVSFVIGIAISLISAGALQEWMSRCYFSKSVSEIRAANNAKSSRSPYPYATAIDELKGFKNAMGI